ncbi:WcbI family polysaccharide biosynthesis putative acetyltransferase [Williamsia sp. SKLECPSW1]
MGTDGRTRHYGGFYGVEGDDSGAAGSTDRPVVLVWGNCQAEALRVVLNTVDTTPWGTVRLPPVHELTADDLPHLDRLLRRTRAVLSQPVRAGYRDLPIGLDDLRARLGDDVPILRWPVVRWGALHPFQVIVRHPDDPSMDPDGVPYHDLRTLAAARDGRSPDEPWDVDVAPEVFREVAHRSADELRRREQRDTDVAVSDILESVGAGATHTVNHPQNAVLLRLGRRIADEMGWSGTVRDPGRTLLGGIRAPVEGRVLDALGVSGETRDGWLVQGRDVSADEIHRTQMDCYARFPGFVDAAEARHGELMDLLGLGRS